MASFFNLHFFNCLTPNMKIFHVLFYICAICYCLLFLFTYFNKNGNGAVTAMYEAKSSQFL